MASPRSLLFAPGSSTVSKVTIFIRGAFPLSRQLDSEAGETVLDSIRALDVHVMTHVAVLNMTTHKIANNRGTTSEVFDGFDLTDGTHVTADLVIFAVGIKPRDDLAKASNINCDVKGGITVNDRLLTSAADVYAIGECASWRGNTYGLIAPGGEWLSDSVQKSPKRRLLQLRWRIFCPLT